MQARWAKYCIEFDIKPLCEAPTRRAVPPTRRLVPPPDARSPTLSPALSGPRPRVSEKPCFEVLGPIRTARGPGRGGGRWGPEASRPGPRPRRCHEVTAQTVLPGKVCFCFTNKSPAGTLPAGARPGLPPGQGAGTRRGRGRAAGRWARRGRGCAGAGGAGPAGSAPASPPASPLPRARLRSRPLRPHFLPLPASLTPLCPLPSILVLALRGHPAWGGGPAWEATSPRFGQPPLMARPGSVSCKSLLSPGQGGRGHQPCSGAQKAAMPGLPKAWQGLSVPLGEQGPSTAPEPCPPGLGVETGTLPTPGLPGGPMHRGSPRFVTPEHS